MSNLMDKAKGLLNKDSSDSGSTDTTSTGTGTDASQTGQTGQTGGTSSFDTSGSAPAGLSTAADPSPQQRAHQGGYPPGSRCEHRQGRRQRGQQVQVDALMMREAGGVHGIRGYGVEVKCDTEV